MHEWFKENYRREKGTLKKKISGTDENGDWIMVSGSPPMYGYLYHKIVTVR
jgi:hypothetical protein